ERVLSLELPHHVHVSGAHLGVEVQRATAAYTGTVDTEAARAALLALPPEGGDAAHPGVPVDHDADAGGHGHVEPTDPELCMHVPAPAGEVDAAQVEGEVADRSW